MFLRPQLISATLSTAELLRPISIRCLPGSKNANLISGCSSRGRLVVRMGVSDRESVVELARVDRFAIGDVVEDTGGGEAVTILRRERASPDFEATLNRLSKWLVAALFGLVILWKHDAEALWAAMGSVMNAWLSTILKRLLNQDRPSALRSDPGMPSSHAQSIFYAGVFSVASYGSTEYLIHCPTGAWCQYSVDKWEAVFLSWNGLGDPYKAWSCTEVHNGVFLDGQKND
ncbi:uncharacterized protein LOC110113651 isoform X2 [Dendrobium catenatum]|uniref:uncharacterized protein LOC110113651 isoform X2 n=1 Tax=Dendrobium catenatum TaxID=906689 RepID=UPI0009F5DB40|nr:uncharacterized protein LOC110113651 isoform X2 [Dendrobium catenatum]XP_028548567.1 uncharacterized protein LOC110113651 isoform X2 [Dendrobium catenatum]